MILKCWSSFIYMSPYFIRVLTSEGQYSITRKIVLSSIMTSNSLVEKMLPFILDSCFRIYTSRIILVKEQESVKASSIRLMATIYLVSLFLARMTTPKLPLAIKLKSLYLRRTGFQSSLLITSISVVFYEFIFIIFVKF